MRRLNRLYVLMLLLVMVNSLTAANILVVDDDNRFDNETQVYGALTNLGIPYDSYDCSASLNSPDSSLLSAYDLVIWFTGDDSAALYFWNGTDTENPHIINYLAQGGKLWLLGLDILFDMYGAAADTFSVGDFIYDYFGIASYEAQSYANDGSLGVDYLLQTEATIAEQDTIDWNTSSGVLRYVDGCHLTDAAVSHYVMAPESYPLSGLSVIQSQITADYTALSSWINLFYFSNTEYRDAWVGDVLNWFDLPDQQDTLEAFTLIAPVDDAGFLTLDLGTSGIEFIWESNAADSHTLMFFQDGYAIDSVTGLTDTLFNLSSTDLTSLMSGADYAEFSWQVTAHAGYQVGLSNTHTFAVSNQLNRILFVEDDDYQNYEFSLQESLERVGFLYDVFNTTLAAASPDAATLAVYDLVIWYTGSDGVDQYFWSGNDSDNPALADYLDNGGRLWINGLDILYDRYGAAPDAFSTGDFVFDYLGLNSYDAQSSSDGSTLGNPLLSRIEETQLSTLDTLRWRFPTVYNIDAVRGNQRSFNDYVMGPDGYALAGAVNVSHHIGDGFVVLNSFFNYNHIDADSNRDTLTRDIMNWFMDVATGVEPTSVQLNSPTDAQSIPIYMEDSSDVLFTWDVASDVDGEIRGYRFCLGSSEANIADIILSDQTQLDYVTNERFLYDLIPIDQDSIQLFWQVLAYDDHENISASNSQTLLVIRSNGSAPSPFTLISPEDGAILRIHENSPFDQIFSWEPSTGQDGETISYDLEFFGVADSAILSLSTDQTSLNISSEDLLTLLMDMSTVDLTWTVTSSDGESETMASQAHNIRLLHALSQEISILIVDDDDRFNNETFVYTALDDNFLEYSIFDCAVGGASPVLSDMTAFDLVIWLTGDDSAELHFWNGIDEDNAAVSAYLDQGGRMWLFGLDILYDRYGEPPYYFAAGDMMYDYFGTAAYEAQSYANDDNEGLSMLLRMPGSQVTDVDTLHWGTESGILRYADGCDLSEGAMADMIFGPATYQLNGMANSYHATNGNYITMSSWFNPFYMTSNAIRADWFGDIVYWFQNTLTPESLTPSTLGLPAEDSSIELNSLTGSYEFSWETVESSDPVSYQVILTSNAEGVSPLVINTSDTSAHVEAENLFDLTGSGTDQLELTWHVVAMTPMAGYSISETRVHEFIEGINEAPLSFELLAPVPDDTLHVDELGQSYDFVWSSSADPDEDVINYQFILVGVGNDTLVNINTADTSLSLSATDVIDIMGGSDEIVTFWKVFAQDGVSSTSPTQQYLYFENHVVGVADMEIPDAYMLYQNYPNPFNPSTTIRYDLPEAADVTLAIYDVTGQLVDQIQIGLQSAGSYTLQWQGNHGNGSKVSAGIYLCRIQTASYSRVIKMLYLK